MIYQLKRRLYQKVCFRVQKQLQINKNLLNLFQYINIKMGSNNSLCCQSCSTAISPKIINFKNQSQHQWVHQMTFKGSEKFIVERTTQKEKCYYYKHDDKDYLRGIIYGDDFFYEGQIDKNHSATGKGLEKFWIRRKSNQSTEESSGFYEGQFEDNARHGSGSYQDQSIKFQGKWKKGLPISGFLQIKAHPLSKSQTIQAGQARQYQIKNIIFHNANMTTGEVSMILPDKSKYQGQISKNNKDEYTLQGRGTLFMPNGDKFDGIFKQGKFHGQGVYTWKNQHKIFEGNYQNGLKEGYGKLYLREKKYLQGEWSKDKKQGVFKIIEVDNEGNKRIWLQQNFKNDKKINEK